jgi:hypothetical protein
MTTYTLTFLGETLLCVAPDGEDHRMPSLSIIGKATYVAGCTLTDYKPADATQIVWSAWRGGLLTDRTGRDWTYAVKE